MNNRLQFRHHNSIFSDKETAIDYIKQAISYEEQGMPYSAEQEIKKAFPEI